MRQSAILIAATFLAAACQQPADAAEKAVRAPEAKVQSSEGKGLKSAIFAGGCFWGVEGVFSHTKGVRSAVSGYHGGSKASASYKLVGSGKTGHAEAVRVTYDPSAIRYDELLRIFFSVVTDPTQLNRQGPDTGSEYRSALVPLDADQRKVAAAYLSQLDKSGVWGGKVVTKIEPYKGFYKAEAYHQDFMLKNPDHRYIVAWDAPKLAAFRKMYPSWYKTGFSR